MVHNKNNPRKDNYQNEPKEPNPANLFWGELKCTIKPQSMIKPKFTRNINHRFLEDTCN